MKHVFIVVLSGFFLIQGLNNDRGKNRDDTPYMFGIYEVTEFIKDGDTLPPLITDKDRWRYLIIEQEDRATVKTMNDEKQFYKFKPDSAGNALVLYRGGEENETPNFTYELSDSDTLRLKGKIYLYDHEIILKKMNLEDLLLYSRGFNWINETPFNR